ncbi:hypothetical protein [Nitrososphaera sp.]|uniref:hypothetical protein n=1 Tax=Nitrososphaera sp. TaxID=1971748 RepID=UPI00307D0BB1
MPETLCRSCGTELRPKSSCELCGVTLNMVCPGCGNFTDDMVHLDCVLARRLLALSSSSSSSSMTTTAAG